MNDESKPELDPSPATETTTRRRPHRTAGQRRADAERRRLRDARRNALKRLEAVGNTTQGLGHIVWGLGSALDAVDSSLHPEAKQALIETLVATCQVVQSCMRTIRHATEDDA